MHTPTLISITYKPQDALRGAGQDGGPNAGQAAGPVAGQAEGEFQRIAVEQADLIAGYGIAGDRKGGHPTRQLNILSAQTLERLRADGYNGEPGQLGEQLILDGIALEQLPTGTHLLLGDAVVAITGLRTHCPRLETYHPGAQASAAGRVGVMAQVLRGGTIHVGMAVRVLLAEDKHVGVCNV